MSNTLDSGWELYHGYEFSQCLYIEPQYYEVMLSDETITVVAAFLEGPFDFTERIDFCDKKIDAKYSFNDIIAWRPYKLKNGTLGKLIAHKPSIIN